MKTNNNLLKADEFWKNFNDNYLDVLSSEWYKILADIQNSISSATYDFYRSKGMQTLFLPITTASISSPFGLGSDSLPVKIDLLGQECYLADSMQFYLEYGCRLLKNGCFYLMPSFRGEKADNRHLCQFYHSEAEIIGNIEDIISLVEQYVKYLVKYILKNNRERVLLVAGSTEHLEAIDKLKSFPRIKYFDAINVLSKDESFLKKDGELVFITPKGEQELIRLYGGVVWLTDMDKRVVPFYQAENSDGKTARCADLLFGQGEVVGAGERHVDGASVKKALLEHGVDLNAYGWYSQMKDKYPLLTSGFGLGTERFLLWVLNHNDIRDCQIIPRFNGEKVTI